VLIALKVQKRCAIGAFSTIYLNLRY
jgi:hypothetical protein